MAQNFHIAPLTVSKGKESNNDFAVQAAGLHQAVFDSRSDGENHVPAQISEGKQLGNLVLQVGEDAVSNDSAGTSNGARKSNRVIIVGAGIAGLRAASVLRTHGVEVVVLEGRPDRIGGRICTSRKANAPPRDIGKHCLGNTSIRWSVR
jgi:heterodisulfide reductase subunit A-like polyferredoxin